MLVRIIRTIFGILLLPLAFASGKAFYLAISTISIFSNSLRLLERGAFAYLIFHIFFFRPAYVYVFGHELVHALACVLSGGKVTEFRVTREGGGVVTSKTNFFIELSPYFVPIYTILFGIVYALLRAFSAEFRHMPETFLFVTGFTLAFHFVMTSEVLRLKQPDILRSGYIFSFVVVFVGNILVLMAVFSPILGLDIGSFFRDLYSIGLEAYSYAADKAEQGLTAAVAWYNDLLV